MNEADFNKWKSIIENMTHEEMCRVWRSATPGEFPFFDTTSELWSIFKDRFDSFGGFTAEISKKIGW